MLVNISKHVLTQSLNHKEVYACLTQEPLSKQVARNPHLLQLAIEVVAKQTLTEAEVALEYDLQRDIGYSQTLVTAEHDAIFYAKLTGSPYFTRFVKSRKNDQTSLLSLKLAADQEGNYELKNVWMGPMYLPTPDEPSAVPESVQYWKTHAFIFNGQAVLSTTVTKDWPY